MVVVVVEVEVEVEVVDDDVDVTVELGLVVVVLVEVDDCVDVEETSVVLVWVVCWTVVDVVGNALDVVMMIGVVLCCVVLCCVVVEARAVVVFIDVDGCAVEVDVIKVDDDVIALVVATLGALHRPLQWRNKK